ncbi:hypothetical protein DY023_00040 [Microbacterium bovistercoris]|uniref:Large extracellular alpha-helical protein n=1 Tax=Microbacterium bovistercoris TaxID=2293570 RepID=A0A371NZL1_9MICO|nr:DUF5719 family protein [Microbacterium bovistercoris]REJ08923.1 hypothetical protein DY023_00040 [Microbacterium bovistercoris]
MTANRALRVAATSARVLTGAIVAAGCVLGVIAGIAAPWPGVEHQPAKVSVTPVPGDSVLVCNGSFRALGRDTTQADLMISAGEPRTVIGGSDGDPASAALAMPGLAGGSGARSLTGAVQDREAPLIAGAESLSLRTDDLVGLSASACRAPQMQTWLVGGDASTGAADVIVLSNASEVPSTVTLTVYGVQTATSSQVVPPMTQIAVPLSSIAPDETTPVVLVAAEGAPVRASLQSSFTQVLQPIGSDVQDGMADAQRSLVLTGVQVTSLAGDGDAGTVLRMLSPGADGEAVITVRREQTDESVEYRMNLLEGVPSELSLGEMPVGTYDVEITADEPLVAAVRQSIAAGRSADFAWMTPAPEITSDLMFAVPRGPSPLLHLVNPGDAQVSVGLRDGDDTRTVEVPAGESVAVRLRGGSTPVLSPDGPVHASITMLQEAESDAAPDAGDSPSAPPTAPPSAQESVGIAGWPLWPDAQRQPAITVYP